MCVSVFRRDQSNKVKATTFGPIIRIMQLRMDFLDANTFGVREMAELYLLYIPRNIATTMTHNEGICGSILYPKLLLQVNKFI